MAQDHYEIYPVEGGVLQWAGPAESREAALNTLCADAGGTDATDPDMQLDAFPAPGNDDDMMNRVFDEDPF